ncbi:FUSC family protein [uncultured Jatrophihabitans sp.]|uniref:FUSC family protein n=1 Tax=uncultured Jatrophihabitans sp. TaxID=1610747 RepID=UPI0035CC4170
MSSMQTGPVTVARASVAGLLRQALKLDRTQSDPVVALRNAVGVAAPLAVGIWTGDAQIGLAATVGALQTAFADRPGPYRLRIARMLGTAAAAGVTSTLAVLTSHTEWAAVLLLLVLAFGAGLLLSAGPAATQVGTAAVATALVLGHLPQPPSVAVNIGLLVLAGGAFQSLLAVAAWPLRRHRPERVALAALYRDLAAAARLPRGTRVGPPAGDTLTTARQTLYGLGHDHGPSVEAYRVLLDEGERVRREIIVLGAVAERLADEKNPILSGFVRESLTAAGSVLDELAVALDEPRGLHADVLDRARATIRFAIDRLENSDDAPGELTRRAAAARLRALSGQLRAVVESAGAGTSEGRHGDRRHSWTPHLGAVREQLDILRANLTPDSSVVRHAVRVSVLVAGADLVTRLVGFDRGYWVSLTILVVLRPDFASTLQRSVMRTLGTIIGLLAATALVHWVPGGQWWNVALIFVFAFGMRVAGPGNIGLSAVSLSALVVVLLAINGVAPHATLVDRSWATLIGGGLAVLASLVLLPSWARDQLATRLAQLLESYRRYLLVVADPDAARATLQAARADARRARTDAQASLDRAGAEPVPAQAEVELGRMVLTHSHRFIHAALSIDALRPALRESGRHAELARFLHSAADALAAAQEAITAHAAPRPTPKLRPLQEQLTEMLEANPDGVGGAANAAGLVEATDRITNSLDTLVSGLRREPTRQPRASPQR